MIPMTFKMLNSTGSSTMIKNYAKSHDAAQLRKGHTDAKIQTNFYLYTAAFRAYVPIRMRL